MDFQFTKSTKYFLEGHKGTFLSSKQFSHTRGFREELKKKLEKKYVPALENYGQSCFVRSDFLNMKCVSKTQMMPPPEQNLLHLGHQNCSRSHTNKVSIM